MAVPKLQVTPVRAPGGELVHAMRETGGGTDARTLCGRACAGWRVWVRPAITCPVCRRTLRGGGR